MIPLQLSSGVGQHPGSYARTLMASEDRTQATLRYRAGGSVTQPVPHPIPEAVLQIAQVVQGGPPAPGQMRPEPKWRTRVFLLEGGTHDAPAYDEDTRYPEPRYEEASYVRIQCRDARLSLPSCSSEPIPVSSTSSRGTLRPTATRTTPRNMRGPPRSGPRAG